MIIKEFSYITISANLLSCYVAFGTRLLFGGNLLCQPAFVDRETVVSGILKNKDKVMHDGFWISVWLAINEEILDFMVMALGQLLRKDTK